MLPPPDLTPTGDAAASFNRLIQLMADLRTHCPWDQQQTIESLRHLTIEETYELSDAILNQNYDDLEGELGDLLLHIVFYAKIATELNYFTLSSLIDRLCQKLVRRHPHVYGNADAPDSQTVKKNWEQIKLSEKQQNAASDSATSVLSGVPKSLTALIKAYRIQEKAAGIGFDWPNPEGAFEKITEELGEVRQAWEEKKQQQLSEEIGDLFFALVNFARHLGVNPDDALEMANQKFRRRFQAMEIAAQAGGQTLKDLSLEAKEQLWQAAKHA